MTAANGITAWRRHWCQGYRSQSSAARMFTPASYGRSIAQVGDHSESWGVRW
jgi:hypothetical protein